MTPIRARSLRGQRAWFQRNGERRTHYSLIAALGLKKLAAPLWIEGSINGEVFLKYLKENLIPSLQKGSVVVMDNLSVHKVKGVEEIFKEAEIELIYLPPYSPEFSPIELFWSKLKTFLRRKGAEQLEQLSLGIKEAIETVTPKDIRNWFWHCGYWSPIKV